MIGLRTTSQVVIQTDIVRREELVTLLACDQLEQAVQLQVQERLAQASAQAQSIVQQAQAEAERMRHVARKRFLRSGRLGYAAGQRAAVRDWNRQCIHSLDDAQQRWHAEREHWIEVVVDACSALLHDQDPSALYQRAAHALDRVGALKARGLTVHVAYGQGKQARAAFAALTPTGDSVRIAVCESDAIAPGNCRCEWAGGCLETGLQLELEMLREALGRATPTSPPPAESAPPPHAAAPETAAEDNVLESTEAESLYGEDDGEDAASASVLSPSAVMPPPTTESQPSLSAQPGDADAHWGAVA